MSRVLVVEDEPAIREGLATCLRLRGHEVETSADLASARKALTESRRFDAVVTDWTLPDGKAEALEDLLDEVYWIIVSGQVEGLDHVLGADRVLQKPAPLLQLCELIEATPKASDSEHRGSANRGPCPTVVRAIEAFRALCHPTDGGPCRIDDDGVVVTLSGTVARPELLQRLAARVGGDLSLEGQNALWRLHRDGRPESGHRVVPGDPFPGSADATVDVWVDFGAVECRVDVAETLHFEVVSARARRQRVVTTDLPAEWRELAAVRGWTGFWPDLVRVGPEVAAEARTLWDG